MLLTYKTSHCSTNCSDWGLLPVASRKMKELALMSSNRLYGDPTLKLDVQTAEIETLLEEEVGKCFI